jgi:hypothetical protein
MPTIQERIAEAMDAGYAPQEIIQFYKTSDDPEHQSWYQSYAEKMQQRALEPNVEKKEKVGTGLLDFIEENPKTSAAIGGAVVATGAIGTGAKIYSGIQQRKMQERSLAAYEAQVAKQGLPAGLAETQPAGTVASDPLLEQRIRKATAEADLAQFKTEQAKAKIAQVTQAAPVNVPAPVNLTPADVAARAAALPPPVAAAPVAPPVAPVAPVAAPVASVAPAVAPTPVEVAKAEVEAPAKPPKIRRTKEQIAADSVLKPGYEFRAGFSTADTYLVDSLGPEKYKIARMELNEGKPFGDYNKDLVKSVMDKYRVGEKITPEVAKAAGAGSMSSPGGVPSQSIQRAVKFGGVLGMGLPAWLAARASELPGYDEAMGRAGQAVPGLGVSVGVTPFSRGEEMGKLGSSYVTAGNPQYRSQLEDQLKTEKDADRRSILIDELRKIGAPVPPPR